ncbi:MAG: acetate--CoA ligase family protein [Candidatus Tectomicrobia bacterium]|uniref:Acetate--CoA ligase family protein n=1 Tax=Tectimicrobiota bacterium TaxID=2528274 RepID=A0A932CPG9_UNCTE|nr:acetate--CoA ligase family protein [Candidatus Tectomicrobia bacterium]
MRERPPSSALEALVRPRSIALVGCSPEEEKIQGLPLRFLLHNGYPGKIFPINPSRPEIRGLTCYPSIQAIPPEEEIDLAFLLVPFRTALQALEACGVRGVKSAILGTSGFAEVGGEGLARQEEIRRIVRETGIRVMGPNCLGLVNVPDRVASTFSPVAGLPLIPGKVALVSQSGSVGGSILNRLMDRGVGVNYFFSTGNEADLEAADFMEFLLEDPSIEIVAAFIESFKDARKFLRAADRALELGKPLVILRTGNTEKGARTIQAHTGALAGSARVYKAAFRQKGVLQAEDYDDFVGMITLLAKSGVPQGNRLGVISFSGGAAGVVADQCSLMGIPLPELSPQVRDGIAQMQSFGTAQNPLDLTGQLASDLSLFKTCLRLLLKDENLDSLLVILTNIFGGLGRRLVGDLVEVAREAQNKPLIPFCTAGSVAAECTRELDEGPLSLFRNYQECLRSIRAVANYAEFSKKKRGPRAPAPTPPPPDRLEEIRARLQGKVALTEEESKALLAHYGIPVTRESLATSLEEARAMARKIGYPVALKVISPQILHKTEAGVVRLHVRDEAELERAYAQLLERAQSYQRQAQIKGILVQEMVDGGTEAIVGTARDPLFGPTVLFGLGGIFVEVFQDISLRLAPIGREEAHEMILEIQGYEILAGARGRARGEIEGAVDTLVRLSQLSLDLGDLIEQIDINPLMILPEGQGVKAVDALVVLRED